MTTSSDEIRRMAARRLASSLLRPYEETERRGSATPPGVVGREARVCIVHGKQVARKVVTRALDTRLAGAVHCYSCCEDALRYTEQYDAFVVYNNFGKRMEGAKGVERIRARRPQSLIIGVTSVPAYRQEFLSAGADEAIPLSANEVEGLARRIERRYAPRRRSPGEGEL